MRSGSNDLQISFNNTFNKSALRLVGRKRQNQPELTLVSSSTRRENMITLYFSTTISPTQPSPKNLQKLEMLKFTERHYTAPQFNHNFTTMLTAVIPNRLTEYTAYEVITHPEIPP